MTTAESIADRPRLAAPPRPPRPLSTARMLRAGLRNSLAVWDEELFDALIVARRFLWYRLFIVSDPEAIRRVLQDNIDNYPRIDQIRRIFAFGSGTGMLSAEGEESRRHRRLINPTLDPRAIQPDVPELIRLAGEMAAYIGRLPPGQPIDIGETTTHLLTRCTGHVFAGDDGAVDPMLHRLGLYPGKYGLREVLVPGWLRRRPGSGKGRAEAAMFRPLLDRLIAERRCPAYDGPRDLIWRLVNATDGRGGDRLDDRELHDELLTLGATAATPLRPLSWIWYLLALHPWAEAKLHAELDAVLGGRSPTPDDLPRLVYLRRVLDETMRLYPPLPIMMRVARAADELGGVRVPRNAVVLIMPWIVHRHRKLWRDPDRFDPDRFAPEAAAARSRYSYLPFSVGPHVCVGASLAMTEMIATVAALAQRFRFRLVPGHPVAATAWTNLRPLHGIKITAEPR